MEGFVYSSLLLLFLSFIVPVRSLHITDIRVPQIAFSGDKVRLTCSFALQQRDELYSLTWWKDDKMFFKFVPKTLRPKSVYDVPGITVDEQNSTLHDIILSRVDHRASGKLRCEVLAAVSFEQDTKDANMTVIDLPTSGPIIIGRRGNYRAGDLLLLNCSCPPSFPPTTLSWHINGHQAETVIVFPSESDAMGRKSSLSGVQMRLGTQHFAGGQGLLLRCTANILDLYTKSAEVLITDENYIESSPREGASTGGSSRFSLMTPSLILVLLVSLIT